MGVMSVGGAANVGKAASKMKKGASLPPVGRPGSGQRGGSGGGAPRPLPLCCLAAEGHGRVADIGGDLFGPIRGSSAKNAARWAHHSRLVLE